jgi:signal transduction histidine kinase
MVLPVSVPGGYGLTVAISQTVREAASEHREAPPKRVPKELSESTRALGIQNAHLAAASHELRGPLNVVIGMAETMIQRHGELSEEVQLQLLQRISSSGKKMDRILTDLFEVMRAEEEGEDRVDRTAVDLQALVRRSIDSSDQLDGRTVCVHATGNVLEADSRMVERILDNLLSNAAKHSGPTGRIWVNVTEAADGVTIAVDDEGPGVAIEDRKRIFERFERGAGVMVSGLGIGLSVVARFAQLHGGRAWVEDRPGGGASFRVFLPRSSS